MRKKLSFGTLPTILASPVGGWAPMLTAKVIVSSWISLLTFLLLILVIRSFFGIAPKQGLIAQLSVQLLAIVTSAVLGLCAAVWSRNQSQFYMYVAIYFLILVLLSGFLFPLESASTVIRAASNISPLTYSQKLFESWLFFGTDVCVFSTNVALLATQLAVAVLALVVAGSMGRSTI